MREREEERGQTSMVAMAHVGMCALDKQKKPPRGETNTGAGGWKEPRGRRCGLFHGSLVRRVPSQLHGCVDLRRVPPSTQPEIPVNSVEFRPVIGAGI